MFYKGDIPQVKSENQSCCKHGDHYYLRPRERGESTTDGGGTAALEVIIPFANQPLELPNLQSTAQNFKGMAIIAFDTKDNLGILDSLGFKNMILRLMFIK